MPDACLWLRPFGDKLEGFLGSDYLLIVAPIRGYVFVPCFDVPFSFAIILAGESGLIHILCLSPRCLVIDIVL